MSAPDAAAVLREMAALLAFEPNGYYRARAFDHGADVVEQIGGHLPAMVADGRLTSVPGIGPALAKSIVEILTTGRLTALDSLRRRYPPGTAALQRVLSLKRIRVVADALGIDSIDGLRRACDDGRLRALPGFGPATERAIAAKIARLDEPRGGALLPEADEQAAAILANLRRHAAVRRAEIGGDVRRRLELSARLDVAVAATDPGDVSAHAASLVEGNPSGGALVRRPGRLDVALHLVVPERFGATWIVATGDDAHVAALRARAAARGVDLDAIAARDEPAVYAALDLPFIPPELRGGTDAIAAADAGSLPTDLLRIEELRGAVHCHTTWSDGRDSIEAMARAADDLGLGYLTVTDHSASAHYAGGLDVERLRRQADEIAAVQERVRVRILRGTECDILRDGALDFPDGVLARLDVVIASVHERHRLDEAEMTRRLVRAMRHPIFKIWGHALGRYVRSRPPFAVDLDAVLDAAAGSRAAIEINGDPHRLDLAPDGLRRARARGLRFVVSSDAHSTRGIANARFGVDMARRAGLRAADVLNTLGPNEFAAAVRP